MELVYIFAAIIILATGVLIGIVLRSGNKPQDKKVPQKTIKIGHISPMSGEFGYYADWEKRGMDLAVEEINKKGGINGLPVEIVSIDDQTDPILSVEAMVMLARVDKTQAVIGPLTSGSAIAVSPFIKKNKIAVISAIAGATRIPNAGGYFFRIFPDTQEEGKSLLKAAVQRGNKTAAIIYINNIYGVDLAKIIRREAPKAGVEILAAEGYKGDTENFTALLARVREKNPNTVFLLGYPMEMGYVIKQAREMGLLMDFFAPTTFDEPRIKEIAGEAAKGIVYVMPFDKCEKNFTEIFKKKYGHDPDFVDALNYDAVMLLVHAIAKGGYNGTAIKKELMKLNDYQGASGSITFDENGQIIDRAMVAKEVSNNTVPTSQKPQ